MAETTYYDSTLTGEQLDAAFAGLTRVEQSVALTEQNAETAQQYGQIVADNAQGIRDMEENLETILSAPECARTAVESAGQAETFARQAGESAESAAESAQQAQQIAQGAMGWYQTETSLKAAHPAGQNGQWAIIGSTDTIWTWDSDTNAWVDSGDQVDLSDYYNKKQSDARYVQDSALAASILSLIYPVGSIYISTANVSPATFIGGTWQQVKDVFLLAAGNKFTAGATGGEEVHTLTIAEIPGHRHGVGSHGQQDNIGASGGQIGAEFLGSNDYGLYFTDWQGGGQSHNNMPPYLTVYMWQRMA